MKKHLLAALAALLCVLPLTAQSLNGDINKDGSVDVSDVTKLVDLILNPEVIEVPVTSITLSSSSMTIEPQKAAELTATVAPSDATNPEVVWTSSNESVARVFDGYVIGIALGYATITATATDGSGVSARCSVRVKEFINGHDYVDLGLPSRTLWATCNVGAEEPTDYGDYFAWGETSTKEDYSWSTYKWCNGSSKTLTKYCTNTGSGNEGFTDGIRTLEPADDAATMNWGGGWRMHTDAEWAELRSNCTWKWYGSGNAEFNGVAGMKVTSKATGAGNIYIFLPAAGSQYDTGLGNAGSVGLYWSSSLNGPSENATNCYFQASGGRTAPMSRCNGQCVRPVISRTK